MPKGSTDETVPPASYEKGGGFICSQFFSAFILASIPYLGEREIATRSIKTDGFTALRSTHFPERFKGTEAVNKSLERPFGRKT
jgi:hypothetical protein